MIETPTEEVKYKTNHLSQMKRREGKEANYIRFPIEASAGDSYRETNETVSRGRPRAFVASLDSKLMASA